MPRLSVLLNGEQLGFITLQPAGDRYDLEYDSSWLEGPGFAVSPHLKPGECSSEAVKNFLANLLPEGRWLEELTTGNQVSKTNIFGLVAIMGAETAGALTFQYEGQVLRTTEFRPVSREELTERIAQRQQVSIARWDGKLRLSVAGVQEKLPILLMRDGSMGFGEGELASTHIYKFGKHPDMHMVINELLCMELARSVKLPVAKVALERFGEPVLAVERFDRDWDGNVVARKHLIDGCQMLNLPPTYKYERPYGNSGEASRIRTGASLPQLFAACEHCRIPAAARRDLLNWILFQLIIGNSDAHAKNISWFVGKRGIDIAPFYDLLCIDIYGDEYDRDLAMAIGDEFVLEDILPFQLAEMCDDCKLPQRQVANALRTLCTNTLKSTWQLTRREELTGAELAFAQKLAAKLNERAARFLGVARELPEVKI